MSEPLDSAPAPWEGIDDALSSPGLRTRARSPFEPPAEEAAAPEAAPAPAATLQPIDSTAGGEAADGAGAVQPSSQAAAEPAVAEAVRALGSFVASDGEPSSQGADEPLVDAVRAFSSCVDSMAYERAVLEVSRHQLAAQAPGAFVTELPEASSTDSPWALMAGDAAAAARLTSENEALKQEHETLRQQLMSENEALKQEQETLRQQAEALRRENMELLVENERFTEENSKLCDEANATHSQLVEALARVAALEPECEMLRKRLEKQPGLWTDNHSSAPKLPF
mgnify:CR=1 FL=1